jgi:fructose-bisphosphate aldolase, class II
VTLVSTGSLVAAARASGAAVGAFNAITLEHAEAIVAGAAQAGQPVIVQISQNAVRFHGGQAAPLAAACAALGRQAAGPVALHLDHVDDQALLEQAADAGFSSVMFDAGARPYDDNVAATAAAARWAHRAGLWVEAELGYVGGKPDAPQGAHGAGVRTDPDEARAYVAATGVDALAVAVGSSHAMTTRTATIDSPLVARLAAAVPVPLVLHGSSGVPDHELRAAVAAGLTKINIGTALNLAMTAAVRAELADDELVDPRRYLAAGRTAMTAAVATLLTTIAAA